MSARHSGSALMGHGKTAADFIHIEFIKVSYVRLVLGKWIGGWSQLCIGDLFDGIIDKCQRGAAGFDHVAVAQGLGLAELGSNLGAVSGV